MPDLFELLSKKPAAALAAIAKDKRLLAWRSTPNKSSPLTVAAALGSTKLVTGLLELGADVNHARPDGYTALMYAAQNGHAGVVKLLLAARAKLDATQFGGWTALGLATQKTHYDCAAELIRGGAKPTQGNARTGDIDLLLEKGGAAVTRAVIERGMELSPKILAKAFDDDNVDLVMTLVDAGYDKGGKKAAAWAAKSGIVNARAELEKRGIKVPPSKGPAIETIGYADAKALLAKLGLGKKVRGFPSDFRDRALVYRSGLRLPKLRLDHDSPLDGKKGPFCGAGIIVIGDLVVDGTLENGEQDFGPFLIVTGNLVAKNIAVGGADLYVAGDLKVKGTFHGYYNHGTTTIAGATHVGLLLADDYNMKLEGPLEGRFVTAPGYVKSKQKLPKDPPLEKLLAKQFLEADEDEPMLKGHAIYKALVAGKKITR